MNEYNHLKIEPKWRKYWEKKGINKTKDKTKGDKFYVLDMFPYPSGAGLHVGHPRGYVATDVYARFKKMQGYNVLHPMGWDSFGLPAENYAIKNKINPKIADKQNVKRYKAQISILGLNYDWSREINTTDPNYYKWTQWIFLQMFKNGLAFESFEPINWCPSCKTGLANEDLENGKCERCGSVVEKKPMRQWVLRITKYADRLLKDLDELKNWPENVKESQRNWIGRSEGAELEFAIPPNPSNLKLIKVFTTRADTLFGVTYVVLAPENKLVQELKAQIINWPEVEKYINEAKTKTDIERTAINKDKTGVELKGVQVINPANDEKVPVWISDYVLADYGTGAVMAVPAHDERDFAFAKKYNLPIKEVIIPERIDRRNPPVHGKQKIERVNVQVVVRNPKDNKILCLKWKKHDWKTFPMGGVDGEDILKAAKREVLEETGYKNLINGKVLGGQVRAEYFAAHKDVNRISYTSLVSFDLKDEERVPISKEEAEQADIFWADLKDLTVEFMTHAEMDIWLQRIGKDIGAYTEDGVLSNSGKFNGLSNGKARQEITKAYGQEKVPYKLKDWVFSRQRYWGEPIPLIHCEKCGVVAVPEKDLPVKLPDVKYYEPTGTGESPLAAITKWVNVKCPQCGGRGKRETNTMPQWAGSSWYYLRYIDPKNKKALVDKKKEKYWSPVDLYVGGGEHNTRHLIYARFWHKFLYDIGVVNYKEPFTKLMSVGMILASDGRKMSKRWGNVVNPDEVVKNVGADTLRVYEMFMGPFNQEIAWSTNNMVGSRRFLDKVWKLQDKIVKNTNANNQEFGNLLQKTIKKITEDIISFSFNTAISAFMILVNSAEKSEIGKNDYEIILKLLAPFAPHLTEEIWANLGHKKSIQLERWPEFDINKIFANKITINVQINGKVRASFEMPSGSTQDQVEKMALAMESVSKWLVGKEIRKKMFIKEKILSLITD